MDWHGWGIEDVLTDSKESLHIGMLPGRKRPCLYMQDISDSGASITTLASFNSEESAKECLDFLDKLAKGGLR